MNRYLSILLLAAAAAVASVGTAQQAAPKIKVVPVKPTSPTSGQQMFVNYCASCHGPLGKGDGPAAPALKAHPTDLSMLSRNNGGVYPVDRISAVLTSGANHPAHGSPDMPIWGDLFVSLGPAGDSSSAVVRERVHSINDYLKTLQR